MEAKVLQGWLDDYGALAMSGVYHQAEYLPHHPLVSYSSHSPYHGSPEERRRRWQELEEVINGQKPLDQLNLLESWEHPIDLAVALWRGDSLYMPIINLPNRGYLPGVPDTRIVEVPAQVRNKTVQGVPVEYLPPHVAAVCRQVSDVHDLVAEGAATGSREKLADAIRCDITIPDENKGLLALDGFLKMHKDILPRF